MKKILFILFLISNITLFAQKDCEYSDNIKDSLGTFKATKDYLMSEKNFGKKSDFIYFHLANTDGMPTLVVQIINKNNGFVKAKCFDKQSRLFIQLTNQKIIPLVYLGNDTCGTSILDKKFDNVRVISGNFGFPKGSLEELKKLSFSFMRIKFATEKEDFIIKNGLKSEMDSFYYDSSNFFINYLKCIE